MGRKIYLSRMPLCFVLTLLCACTVAAQDAADYRKLGLEALKESQTNPRTIVEAARNFAKAAALFEAQGKDEQVVEMNSYLYWCKKKMNMQDIEAFNGNEDSPVIAARFNAVDNKKIEPSEAQKWFDRAEAFAKASPDEHLLIAIRFFEVADRFKGTDVSLTAQDRSLKEQTMAQGAAAKTIPPVQTEIKARPVAAGKQPLPDAEKEKAARKSVKDIFKDEYLKMKRDDKLALAKRMLQLAVDTNDDMAAKYAELNEAQDLALKAGDVQLAMQTVEAVAAAFAIDEISEKIAVLEKIAPTVQKGEQTRAFCDAAVSLIDQIVKAEQYDRVKSVYAQVQGVIAHETDATIIASIGTKCKALRIVEILHDWPAVKAGMARLKTNPEDPEANLTVGKFFCFLTEDWNRGLPALARGSDAELKTLAESELTHQDNASSLVALGDAWWNYGEREKGSAFASKNRAKIHYDDAIPNLAGLESARVQKRLDTFPKPSFFRGGQLIIWNEHNGHYNNSGADQCDIILFLGANEVWRREDFVIPWKPNRDTKADLDLPDLPYDKIHIDVKSWHDTSGGLSEVQLMIGGKNVAKGAVAKASAQHKPGDGRVAQNLTDDNLSSARENIGYWLLPMNQPGWAEIELTKQAPSKAVHGSPPK